MSFMRLCSKSASCNWIRQLLLQLQFLRLLVTFMVIAGSQFEAGSDTDTLEPSNVVLLCKTKLIHVNTKATMVYSFV